MSIVYSKIPGYIDAEKDYLPDATEWDELFLVSKCN